MEKIYVKWISSHKVLYSMNSKCVEMCGGVVWCVPTTHVLQWQWNSCKQTRNTIANVSLAAAALSCAGLKGTMGEVREIERPVIWMVDSTTPLSLMVLVASYAHAYRRSAGAPALRRTAPEQTGTRGAQGARARQHSANILVKSFNEQAQARKRTASRLRGTFLCRECTTKW